VALPVREKIATMKYLPEDEEALLAVEKEVEASFKSL
jgi:hypothetical protein